MTDQEREGKTLKAIPRLNALILIAEFICGMIAGYNLKKLIDQLEKRGRR